MRAINPDAMSNSDVPLSPGMETNNFIFVSGQIPRDSNSGDIVGDTIEQQTVQTIRNIETVLNQAGADLDDVIKTQVFLTSVEDFSGMNEVYRENFSPPYPARSAFEVGDLAADILVEIEAIAER